jgi:cytochrome c oxidase cbb3-type subunit 3
MRVDPWRSLRWLALCVPMTAACAQSPLLQQGETVFKSRCVVCHGVHADGKSNLAKLLSPPPANLRASKLSLQERTRIISKGGGAVGRSERMPTWEDELSPEELRAVIAYVGTLKGTQP